MSDSKKKRSIPKLLLKIFIPIIAVAIIAAIVLRLAGFGPLYGLYEPKNPDTYASEIEAMGVFDNTLDNAMPQTIIHKLVMEHFSSSLPEGKTVKKAIFLGFDGYRADAIANVKDDPKSAIMYVKSLGGLYHTFAGGVAGVNEQHTSTAPGWCSMLTGGWANYHTVSDNGMTKNDKETFLTTLARQGHATSFTASWKEHFNLTYTPDIALAANENLPVKYNCMEDDDGTLQQVMSYVTKSADRSKTAEEDPDMIFFTFEYTDHNGHLYGFGNNDNYYQGSLDANKYGYQIIKAIEQRDTYDQEDWLIIISTDHGGTGHVHGGQSPMERETWLAINKQLDITDEYLNYANK